MPACPSLPAADPQIGYGPAVKDWKRVMRVNVFRGRGNWYAFAASNDGSVLPPGNGPWVPWKILDMNRGEAPRVGISTDEVLDAIQDGNAYLVEMKTEVVKETFRRT
jgi:hypothetical protein